MSPYAKERRLRPRISTMILCEIRVDTGPAELVRVRDLSECGLRIATHLPLVPGRAVRIRLPGVDEWRMARVAWRDKGLAGLSFIRAVELPHVSGARQGPRAA